METKTSGSYRLAMKAILKKTGSTNAKKDPEVNKARAVVVAIREEIKGHELDEASARLCHIAIGNLDRAYQKYCGTN